MKKNGNGINDTSWIDRKEYPFTSNFLQLGMGKMHYIDEGIGDPVIMVHGNPVWSFVYRHLIKWLSGNYRCLAMDHIGFGLSDKPRDWSYYPEDHAENFSLFIDKLGLKNITLIVQDWGGPIGLSYALDNPDNVKRIVIMNTWMWSLKGDLYYEMFSRFMGGPLGRFLIRRFNFLVRAVMKQLTGQSGMSAKIHDHYLRALESPDDRKGCWTFPARITGSGDWLNSLWSKRDRIKDKPVLILWGMKDIAFREKELNRWTGFFPDCRVRRFNDAGHFLQEEKGHELMPVIRKFLGS